MAPFALKKVRGNETILERVVPYSEGLPGSTETLLDSTHSGFDSTKRGSGFDGERSETSNRPSSKSKRCFVDKE
jgi:hypothetical protein